jgi:membrane dipeptidase
MVTFVPSFLTPAGAAANRLAWQESDRHRSLHPDEPTTVRAGMEKWFASHPDPPAAVGDVADHIDHIRAVAGIDHIGVGGDLDGTPSVPTGLEDVSCYPNLFAELLARGYAEDELGRIARGNILRVMRAAETIRDRLQYERSPSLARIEDLDD